MSIDIKYLELRYYIENIFEKRIKHETKSIEMTITMSTMFDQDVA